MDKQRLLQLVSNLQRDPEFQKQLLELEHQERQVSLLHPQKVLSLPQTQAEFNEQADTFLTSHGIPVTADFLIYYGAGIQQLIDKDADITEEELLKFIQRRHANGLAYSLIKTAVKSKDAPSGSEVKEALPKVEQAS